MPNAVNLRKRISVALGQSNYTPARGFFENEGVWRGHVREYTFQETNQILQWAGFEIVHKSTFHGLMKRPAAKSTVTVGIRSLVLLYQDSETVPWLLPENRQNENQSNPTQRDETQG